MSTESVTPIYLVRVPAGLRINASFGATTPVNVRAPGPVRELTTLVKKKRNENTRKTETNIKIE